MLNGTELRGVLNINATTLERCHIFQGARFIALLLRLDTLASTRLSGDEEGEYFILEKPTLMLLRRFEKNEYLAHCQTEDQTETKWEK